MSSLRIGALLAAVVAGPPCTGWSRPAASTPTPACSGTAWWPSPVAVGAGWIASLVRAYEADARRRHHETLIEEARGALKAQQGQHPRPATPPDLPSDPSRGSRKSSGSRPSHDPQLFLDRRRRRHSWVSRLVGMVRRPARAAARTRAGLRGAREALMFRRIAIVNRGEAAMRLIHAVRELNAEPDAAPIETVALHTDGRARGRCSSARPTRPYAARARRPPAPTSTTPCWSARCASAAPTRPGSGWGFVAEDPEFAELCDRLGVTFIGPSRRGDAPARRQDRRQAAGRAGRRAGRRRGAAGRSTTSRRPRWHAAAIGYPLMIKATAGGGGRGIRVVTRRRADRAFERARAEAARAFGERRGLPRAAGHRAPGTSRCRSSPTGTARPGRSACGTAPCSGATRR